MDFVRTADGKLISKEEVALRDALRDIEAKLDARFDDLSAERRGQLVEVLRQRWAESGTTLNAEDNQVLQLFCESVLDFRHVQGHFGARLV